MLYGNLKTQPNDLLLDGARLAACGVAYVDKFGTPARQMEGGYRTAFAEVSGYLRLRLDRANTVQNGQTTQVECLEITRNPIRAGIHPWEPVLRMRRGRTGQDDGICLIDHFLPGAWMIFLAKYSDPVEDINIVEKRTLSHS